MAGKDKEDNMPWTVVPNAANNAILSGANGRQQQYDADQKTLTDLMNQRSQMLNQAALVKTMDNSSPQALQAGKSLDEMAGLWVDPRTSQNYRGGLNLYPNMNTANTPVPPQPTGGLYGGIINNTAPPTTPNLNLQCPVLPRKSNFIFWTYTSVHNVSFLSLL